MCLRHHFVKQVFIALTLVFAFVTTSFAAPNAARSRYIVRISMKFAKANAAKIFDDSGFSIEKFLPELTVFAVTPNLGIDEKAALKILKKVTGVMYVEKDERIWHISAVPNDPSYPSQANIAQLELEKAWNISTGSSNVVVAVVDTGMDAVHPELAPQLWKNAREIPGNGIDDDRNGYVDDVNGWDFVEKKANITDPNGHGTHVSGIIGAQGNNGFQVAGVNWSTTIMPLRFLGADGSGSTLDAVDAIIYAVKNGAKIINNSWGGGTASSTLRDAIGFANQNGVLLVCAAGNDSSDTDITPNYPSSYDLPNIIAVAATTGSSTLASFSNFGITSVDLAAPGQSILSTYPNSSTRVLSGTSMATPIVSGVAALMLSTVSVLTPTDLRNGLFNAVRLRSGLSAKMATEGELNANDALSELFGGFQIWPKRMVLAKGKRLQLTTYKALGSVQWSSSDNNIATVSSAGELIAQNGGSVTIMARDNSGAVATSEAFKVVDSNPPSPTPLPPGGGIGCSMSREAPTPFETRNGLLSFGAPLLAGLAGRRRWRR
jgi:subtilisin family serine protease